MSVYIYAQTELKVQNQNFIKNKNKRTRCWRNKNKVLCLYVNTSLFASTHNSTVGSRCPCHTSLPQSRQSTLRWLSLKRYIHRVMLELDRAWVLALSPLTLLPSIICFSFSTVFSCTRWTDRLVDRHLHCRINPEFYNSQNKFSFCWIL